MSNYDYSVKATAKNTVRIEITRDGELAYEVNLEPFDIGAFKSLFLVIFSCMTKIQRLMLEEAHKVAKKYIKNMKELEK